MHETLAKALFVIALVHILAALKHEFIDKDQILQRMSSGVGWLIFLGTIAIGIIVGRNLTSTSGATQSSNLGNSHVGQQAVLAESALIEWNIDYADSHIWFSGEQAGAPFTGEWQSWAAKIQFDSSNLDQSRFDVSIQVDSVFSDDATRDETIEGVDFFNHTNFPKVHYLANKFGHSVDGSFTAEGLLTIKGLQKPAPLVFRIEQDGNKTILIGSATIDRLSWNVGLGDWTDTTWVGKDVEVDVRVAAGNK